VIYLLGLWLPVPPWCIAYLVLPLLVSCACYLCWVFSDEAFSFLSKLALPLSTPVESRTCSCGTLSSAVFLCRCARSVRSVRSRLLRSFPSRLLYPFWLLISTLSVNSSHCRLLLLFIPFGSQGRLAPMRCCLVTLVFFVSSICVSDFQFSMLCGWLQGEAGSILESPDQKTRGFMI
jgi:hypothetical protein